MKALYTLPILMVFLGIGACASHVPVPTNYPQTYQQRMLTAHHWNVLADTVAQRLADALIGANPTGETVVLNVQGARCCTTFNQAFHDLLMTHLLQKGFGVTVDPNAGLPVKYQVQVITHEAKGLAPYLAVPTSGAGAYSGAVVAQTPQMGFQDRSAFYYPDRATPYPHPTGATATAGPGSPGMESSNAISEVIVTTSVVNGARLVTRLSDIYYISDGNRDQYLVKAPPATRRFEVTGSR